MNARVLVWAAGLLVSTCALAQVPSNQAPEGWTLVFQDDFNRADPNPEVESRLGPWEVNGGKWEIRDNVLHRVGPRENAMIFCAKRFGANQRLEFDCLANEPQDFFAILCGARQHWEAGYLFAYSVAKPSQFRIADKAVAENLPGGELGKWHHVVCQVEDYEMSFWADGKLIHKKAYSPALRGETNGNFGIYCYASTGQIDNIKLFTKATGEAGKAEAVAVDVKPPKARPVSVSATHDTDYVPSLEYVTPRVPYAKPYAQGPVKALFCVWACAGRSIVELHQRMDLEFDYVSAGENNMLWRGHPLKKVGDDEGARVQMLLQKPHDVIVLGEVRWTWYPEEVRAEILRQVEAGTGLVFMHSRMPTQEDGKLFELFQKATVVDPAQTYFPSERAKVVELRKGRIAFEENKDRSVNEDFLKCITGFTEKSVEKAARTILWAAKKEPSAGVSFKPVALRAAVTREALAGAAFEAQPGQPGPRDHVAAGTLRLDIRRDLDAQYPLLYGSMPYQFRPYASWEDACPPLTLTEGNGGVWSVKAPPLPAGTYQLTYTFVSKDGKVMWWQNVPLEVTSSATISEIRLGKQNVPPVKSSEVAATITFRAEDTARVQATVQGDAKNLRLRVTLSDRDGRIAGKGEKPVAALGELQGAEFDMPLHRALHPLLVAKVELLQNGQVIAEMRAPVAVLERPERVPAFRMRAYGCSMLRPELTTYNISYRQGYGVKPEEAILQHAWHDSQLGEFSSVLAWPASIGDDGVRTPSYSDPKFLEQQKKWVSDRLQPFAAFGFNLLLCDEWIYGTLQDQKMTWPKFGNQDFSEPAKSAFREFLKREYAALDALNAEWGSQYKGWEEVAPPVYDKDPAKAPPEQAWPQIVDHRAFVEKSVADFIREIADTAHKISPAMSIGTSGHYSAGMWTGRDYYQWAKYGPHIVTYREFGLWQSFTPQRVAAWIGYGAELRSPAKENYRAWKDLFEGIEKAYWGREMPPFAPDFTLLPAPAQYFAAKREIRDSGIGDMLMNAQGANRIGILYHPRSFTVYNLKDWQATGADYIKRVSAINKYGGYVGAYMEKFPPGTYHWVHTEQFIRNDFGAYGKPTVVILPQTEALGDEEAQALRKYVEDGGFLVADRNPGIRDAHGRRRAKGALDDLFAPGAPKPVGKGKTLLLNALPQDADFDRIMAFAGLAPDWRVEQGTTPIVMMTRDYRRGEHLYFGCTGNSALDAAALKNTQAAIVLAEPMHCYDSRRGTYLGETDRIPVRFESPNWMGNVFACLPYRVEGITIEGLKPQYAPGDVVSFAARMAPAAAQKQVHTLRLQVLNQAGREVNVYADRIETANGVARGEIPLAFNDRAGAWKVAVTDVASGVRSESPFLVKE